MTCDVTGLLKMNSKVGHRLSYRLVSLNSFRCLCGGHVICDVTGLLKMNSKMGQRLSYHEKLNIRKATISGLNG